MRIKKLNATAPFSFYRGFLVLLGIGVLCAGAMPTAYASLGGNAASIDKDQSAIGAKASTEIAQNGAYSVTTLESNTVTVREFINPQGVVFGVTWKGRVRPSFTQFLGSHFNEYRTAAAQQQKGALHSRRHRSAHSVRTGSFVLESAGHMRNQMGRTYLPSEIPSGVSIDEIK
jgi:hypothetical protein